MPKGKKDLVKGWGMNLQYRLRKIALLVINFCAFSELLTLRLYSHSLEFSK